MSGHKRYLLLVSKIIVKLFIKCVHFYKYNAISEEIKGMESYTLSEEEWSIQKEKLYARIRAEYGEDAI